jgi:hypothetical protein
MAAILEGLQLLSRRASRRGCRRVSAANLRVPAHESRGVMLGRKKALRREHAYASELTRGSLGASAVPCARFDCAHHRSRVAQTSPRTVTDP